MPSTRNCTPATPTLSVAVAVRLNVPLTVCPAVGEAMLTAGTVVSARATVTLAFARLPAASRAVAVSVCEPAATALVFHERLYGEAVVFFDKKRAADFKYIRKQGMHLPSKMRFISAQFETLLGGDLWRRSAARANRMARVLASELEKIPQIKLTQPVEANGVFAEIPEKFVPALQKKYFFYVWNEETSECRFMASFDTTEDDVRDFVALVRKTVK